MSAPEQERHPPLPVAEGIPPHVIVLMGVSGSGKTSVAEGLHNLLGWPFQEGDLLHPKANVDKMAAGIPLTDEDRLPWLGLCHAWIAERLADGGGGILTCSALKRSYRDILRGESRRVTFIYLDVPKTVLETRLARRQGHYMPPSLLPSQLATLEVPTPDEHALIVECEGPPAEVIARVLSEIRYHIGRLGQA
ncbi:gluconokinase [Gluconacetobacter liquefaciens]|uniref:Gluconokinase n=1 Tax=Gluconacetobacter liquefaciens TaxID=89584 RepID=A0A370GA29_GLULI|nr:gluconokinase [Gluconacetobacter liquefaciens]MBB2185250.1 gluconokinase [Gluconacetobacter liquefaciens]RDI40685.1 gluconokinase [Gluconacetobacter liquefaciens]GEB36954.1 gluconokinase [Gluconacetobacter liquefaciens]